jgi:hypothetical protein
LSHFYKYFAYDASQRQRLGKIALPLINIICEALIGQMKLESVKSLNEIFNIEGSDYIRVSSNPNQTENVAPPKKQSPTEKSDYQILKVISKIDQTVKYEKVEQDKSNYLEVIDSIIEEYLSKHKKLISEKCKIRRALYESYKVLNILPPSRIEHIRWNI